MKLPWVTSALGELENALARGRLPHALLVAWPSGWGGEVLVGEICALLLEEAGPFSPERVHPETFWLAPDGVEIKVDDLRQLTAWAVTRPLAAPRKVANLMQAHRMNTNAANALLKTLEEPAAETYLILQTESLARLLPTVRSRCQQVPLTARPADAMAWLQAQHPQATDYLAECGGGPLDALALAASEEPRVSQLIAGLGDDSAALDRFADGDLVDRLGRWYRVLIQELAESPSRRQPLLAFADELLDTRRQIDRSNAANARLLMERLAYRWTRVREV